MKDGITIQELVQEVKRRSENKVDYIARTRDLRLDLTPLDAAIAQAATLNRTVAADGGRHVALADWLEGGMRYRSQAEPDIDSAIVPASGNGHAHQRPTHVTSLVVQVKENDKLVDKYLPLNDLAHDQLATHLAIPARYYDRLREDFPELLKENVNTLIQAAPQAEHRMVRSLDGVARAFLSDSYEQLDNWDLMRFLMPLFAPQDTKLRDGTVIKCLRNPDGTPISVTFRSCNVTDTNLYIKLVCKQITAELKVGQTVRAGVIIKNSEVGMGKIAVFPFYEVLQCKNGAYLTEWGNSRRHVGRAKGGDVTGGNDASKFYSDATKKARDKSLFLQMADVVRGTLTEAMFSEMLEPMREAMGVKLVGQPQAAIEVVGRNLGLAEDEQDDILNYLIQGGDLSIWGLSNAITRFSQDVESYDRATELEGVGGRVITLPPSEWREIAEATKTRKRKNGNGAAVALLGAGR